MATMYCALCNRRVEARRQIGVGTAIGAVLTGGFWLLAIPFYPKRCSICRSTAVSDSTERTLTSPHMGPHTTELEQRLSQAEGELESTNEELDRLRTERDFYRQLLGDRAPLERK